MTRRHLEPNRSMQHTIVISLLFQRLIFSHESIHPGNVELKNFDFVPHAIYNSTEYLRYYQEKSEPLSSSSSSRSFLSPSSSPGSMAPISPQLGVWARGLFFSGAGPPKRPVMRMPFVLAKVLIAGYNWPVGISSLLNAIPTIASAKYK